MTPKQGGTLGSMISLARTAVVFMALTAALGSQAAAPAVKVDGGQIFRDVEKLAADDMEGRLVGSPGGQRAREYVVARLEQAGVRPIGNSFERPFTFVARGREQQRGTNIV